MSDSIPREILLTGDVARLIYEHCGPNQTPQDHATRLLLHTLAVGIAMKAGSNQQTIMHGIPTAAVFMLNRLLEELSRMPSSAGDPETSREISEATYTTFLAMFSFWIHHRLDPMCEAPGVNNFVDKVLGTRTAMVRESLTSAETGLVRKPREQPPSVANPLSTQTRAPLNPYLIPPQQTIPQGTGALDAVNRQRRDRQQVMDVAARNAGRKQVEINRILAIFDELRTSGMYLVNGPNGRVAIPPRAILYDETSGHVLLVVNRKDSGVERLYMTFLPEQQTWSIRRTMAAHGWGETINDPMMFIGFQQFVAKLAELIVPLEYVHEVTPAAQAEPADTPRPQPQISTRERIISIGDQI